ncbi:hypothetical protein CCACVL1_01449 [Corchorus capsularis]|uniref:Uncharacterized protein n=1 Tax=Corchorus capsularis TaxID=210143 RepID=A0A1R3KI22_COCAP|nr:hypothetical protein CCACVL1_01449 [Corchorus capsularis]
MDSKLSIGIGLKPIKSFKGLLTRADC